MDFEKTITIPIPIISPMGLEITEASTIEEIWDAFINPTQEEELPPSVEMRCLMAVLRAVYAGLDPEGSGWAAVRKDQQKTELEEIKDQIEGLMEDIHEPRLDENSEVLPYDQAVIECYNIVKKAIADKKGNNNSFEHAVAESVEPSKDEEEGN